MARQAKPIEFRGGDIPNHVYKARLDEERKLTGDSDKVHEPPEWLCDLGKQKFLDLVYELEYSDLVTNLDIDTLAIIADACTKMFQANEIIKRDGLLQEYTNKNGHTNVVQNPAVLIYEKYNAIYKKYMGDFPLSPAARAKLANIKAQAKKEEADPFVDMFGGYEKREDD